MKIEPGCNETAAHRSARLLAEWTYKGALGMTFPDVMDEAERWVHTKRLEMKRHVARAYLRQRVALELARRLRSPNVVQFRGVK